MLPLPQKAYRAFRGPLYFSTDQKGRFAYFAAPGKVRVRPGPRGVEREEASAENKKTRLTPSVFAFGKSTFLREKGKGDRTRASLRGDDVRPGLRGVECEKGIRGE